MLDHIMLDLAPISCDERTDRQTGSDTKSNIFKREPLEKKNGF